MHQLNQVMDIRHAMEADPVSKLALRKAIEVRGATILRGAVAMMRYRPLGCAIIVERGKPIGTFTERSVIEVLTKEASLDNLPVKQFIDRNFHRVRINDPIAMAWNAAQQPDVRFVCVTDERGQLVGLTGHRGLAEYVAGFSRTDEGTESVVTCEALESTVSQLQTRPCVEINSNETIRNAVETLHRLQVASLLVVDDEEKLAGILTERDILERVAEQYTKLADCPIRDVMTTDPLTVYESDQIATALQAIVNAGHRHVPVLSDAGTIHGIVSPRRVLSHLVN